jgi:hypothetical protein
MNERLTKRDTDGQAMMDCQKCEADWTGKHGKPMADCTALYCRNRLKDLLAAYEDTGMTPEEIDMDHEAAETLRQLCRGCNLDRLEKLAEADKDGRIVVLPCKVGDTVYRLQYIEQTPGRFVVGVAEIKFALLWLEEFGETVFLTREEAEAALEAMKND